MTVGPGTARFAAFGTGAAVIVSDRRVLAEAEEAVRVEVDAMDRAASRFRSDSDLAAINAGAGRPVVVDPLTVQAVETALRGARLSDGLVDPTVGASLRVLGYDRDFASVDPSGPPLTLSVKPVAGWRLVWTDAANSTVRVPAGVELDLGATAKALCADRAAAAAARRTGEGVLVSLGGDIAVAGPVPAGAWVVQLADRHDAPTDGPGPRIVVAEGGLATSGTTARRWRRGARDLHHIVDPTTGAPAESPWRTVSVVAATCVDANIASTTSIILGAGAPAWLAAHHLAGRLVAQDGRVVTVGGWPDDGDTGPEPGGPGPGTPTGRGPDAPTGA
jgi:thiamine biosynthesis lipoprotein